MIVNENASAMKTLADVLCTKGHRVIEALNSDEFLSKTKSVQPDIIIAKALLLNHPDIVKVLQFRNHLENVFLILSNEDKSDDEHKS